MKSNLKRTKYTHSSSGGGNNIACGVYTSISGGFNNVAQAVYSTISGGESNYINSIHSVVSGGCENCIIGGTHFSVIAGGVGNNNCGEYSSIQGGCGNTIPFGQSFVGVFGCNITTVNDKTMHLNNVWLDPSTYFNYLGIAPSGFFAPGTVYVDTCVSCGYLLRMAI